jgi:hypothetical protein
LSFLSAGAACLGLFGSLAGNGAADGFGALAAAGILAVYARIAQARVPVVPRPEGERERFA